MFLQWYTFTYSLKSFLVAGFFTIDFLVNNIQYYTTVTVLHFHVESQIFYDAIQKNNISCANYVLQ